LNKSTISSHSSSIIAVTHQATLPIDLISSELYIIHNQFFVISHNKSPSFTEITFITFSPGCSFIIFHHFLNLANISLSIFLIEFLFVTKIRYFQILSVKFKYIILSLIQNSFFQSIGFHFIFVDGRSLILGFIKSQFSVTKNTFS
jgi:hypothetical protein